jgi:hypothetical protein
MRGSCSSTLSGGTQYTNGFVSRNLLAGSNMIAMVCSIGVGIRIFTQKKKGEPN